MTLKPIPGAPNDAPIPDFPTGNPGPLVVPESRFTRRPVEPISSVLPTPTAAPARRPGPIEIRGFGNGTLTFRAIPELPAINRSCMTVSVTGEPTGDASAQTVPHLELSTDAAKAFLLALRDGASPIVVADSRSGFQVEFVVAEDGSCFTVSKLGHESPSQRFKVGLDADVKTMAIHLLAELGP
jgi:hypothetical protein